MRLYLKVSQSFAKAVSQGNMFDALTNPNLHTEKRADKRGHVVTRHVRAQEQGSMFGQSQKGSAPKKMRLKVGKPAAVAANMPTEGGLFGGAAPASSAAPGSAPKIGMFSEPIKKPADPHEAVGRAAHEAHAAASQKPGYDPEKYTPFTAQVGGKEVKGGVKNEMGTRVAVVPTERDGATHLNVHQLDKKGRVEFTSGVGPGHGAYERTLKGVREAHGERAGVPGPKPQGVSASGIRLPDTGANELGGNLRHTPEGTHRGKKYRYTRRDLKDGSNFVQLEHRELSPKSGRYGVFRATTRQEKVWRKKGDSVRLDKGGKNGLSLSEAQAHAKDVLSRSTHAVGTGVPLYPGHDVAFDEPDPMSKAR